MKKGKYVVFEGISGTGKETQAALLHDFLAGKGISSEIVFHPTPELKEILSVWRRQKKINHIAEVYFLLADRYDRMTQVIRPALEKGAWVISLRSYISALVYQSKNQEEADWITGEFRRFEPEPDILFWFDIEPEQAMDRIMSRHANTGEAIGKFETPDYLFEKRNKYTAIMKNRKHILIDASQKIEVISAKITGNIEPFI